MRGSTKFALPLSALLLVFMFVPQAARWLGLRTVPLSLLRTCPSPPVMCLQAPIAR